MVEKYYLDACIWIDYYEDRSGQGGRPLGYYAGKLFMKLVLEHAELLISDILIKDIQSAISKEDIENMLQVIGTLVKISKISAKKEQLEEAKNLADERKVPLNDAVHAVIARANKAILISQDNHYRRLKDITEAKRPEEIT